MPPNPFVKSFLISDVVLQDRGSVKWSVIGFFYQVYAPTFPCVHPTVAIYVRLTDAHGRYRVRIEFRDEQDKIVATFEGIEIAVEDRLRGVEFGFTTHGLRLEKPGRYQFQLYLNDDYAAAAPLHVIKMERPPEKKKP